MKDPKVTKAVPKRPGNSISRPVLIIVLDNILCCLNEEPNQPDNVTLNLQASIDHPTLLQYLIQDKIPKS